LEDAAAASGYSMRELTVLSSQRDPYRLDTAAGHRDGVWFAAQVARFLDVSARIHLRGLHYLISSAGDAAKPNGTPYVNTDEDWEWLQEKASKAARWLGYTAFEKIIDERNAPAEVYVPYASRPSAMLSPGSRIEVPLELESAMPHWLSGGFEGRQAYRLCLIGEKTSLRTILLPIAEQYGTELLLPTGESSETMIAESAGRAAADARPLVVLYFADFDPGGRQMAVSVARKLQAHRDLYYPDLDVSLYPVALTLEQANELDLPSTPLKETERRADRWRAVMGREQTEVDSLIALNPAALESIAREAIGPFYDSTLNTRVILAWRQWRREATALLEAHPAYRQAGNDIEEAFESVRESVERLHAIQADAQTVLEREIEPPPIEVPAPLSSGSPPEPLFTTKDDYLTASRKLIEYKALEGEA
jgi:hypothetical protein